MKTIRAEQEIEVVGRYDVIVAGGGVAGVAAAVSAARLGKRVLLIEKAVTLGGLATNGLVNWFVPSCDGRGVKIVRGMAEEFFELAVSHGYDTVPEEWRNGNEPGKSAKTRCVTAFSANIFALELTALLQREGVSLLFDTVVTRPIMENGYCRALIVENKSGTQCYEASVVIDATGDADVLYRAGVPTVQGKNYHTFYAFLSDLVNCETAVRDRDIRHIYKQIFAGPADLYGNHHPIGKPFWLGTTGEDVTNYIVENHMELLEKLSKDDRVTRDLAELPHMAQLRTTRRLNGDYTLTTKDVYRHFEDSVSALNDFEHRDFLYEIPYRVMVRRGFGNLIAAGRITSGDGYGWDLLRVIPPAIVTGQAAGAAASIAVDDGVPVTDIDIAKLQRVLSSCGMLIHFEDSPVRQADKP